MLEFQCLTNFLLVNLRPAAWSGSLEERRIQGSFRLRNPSAEAVHLTMELHKCTVKVPL